MTRQKASTANARGRKSSGGDMVHIVRTVARNLSYLMSRHHLCSNAKVAARAGVSSNTVGRMRRGDNAVTLVKVDKVAKALRVPVADLLSKGLGRRAAKPRKRG